MEVSIATFFRIAILFDVTASHLNYQSVIDERIIFLGFLIVKLQNCNVKVVDTQ